MWRARYREDRVEESRGMPSEVSEKVRAIVSQPVQTYSIPPFVGEDPYIPLGVAESVLMRPRSLWGRYEAMPLTKRQLTQKERRIPLG